MREAGAKIVFTTFQRDDKVKHMDLDFLVE
jgi:hypothetical protein